MWSLVNMGVPLDPAAYLMAGQAASLSIARPHHGENNAAQQKYLTIHFTSYQSKI